jgi:hypothetical protein
MMLTLKDGILRGAIQALAASSTTTAVALKSRFRCMMRFSEVSFSVLIVELIGA